MIAVPFGFSLFSMKLITVDFGSQITIKHGHSLVIFSNQYLPNALKGADGKQDLHTMCALSFIQIDTL